jgi:hypothetical protein
VVIVKQKLKTMNEPAKLNKLNESSLKAIEQEAMMKIDRINKDDASKLLGVSPQTILNYTKKGLLKAYKMGTTKQSKVWYKRADVIALMGYTANEQPA